MKPSSGKITTPHDNITFDIIGVAMRVHNEVGPGFTEDVYHNAMVIGLAQAGYALQREHLIEVRYQGHVVGQYKLDLVVNRRVVVELKAVAALQPVHERQLIAYLAASGAPVGLLINFGAAKLDYRRLLPPKAVQDSSAYQARQAKVIASPHQSPKPISPSQPPSVPSASSVEDSSPRAEEVPDG